MKVMNTMIQKFGLVFILLMGLFVNSNAQCDTEQYTDNCLGELKSGYTFVKSFKIDGKSGKKDKVETSYVFAKGTKYYLNVCSGAFDPNLKEEDSDGIVVSLYNGKRKLVGTNFVAGKFYQGINFPCNATGIYYITYTFKDSEEFCGGSVLGFKR